MNKIISMLLAMVCMMMTSSADARDDVYKISLAKHNRYSSDTTYHGNSAQHTYTNGNFSCTISYNNSPQYQSSSSSYYLTKQQWEELKIAYEEAIRQQKAYAEYQAKEHARQEKERAALKAYQDAVDRDNATGRTLTGWFDRSSETVVARDRLSAQVDAVLAAECAALQTKGDATLHAELDYALQAAVHQDMILRSHANRQHLADELACLNGKKAVTLCPEAVREFGSHAQPFLKNSTLADVQLVSLINEHARCTDLYRRELAGLMPQDDLNRLIKQSNHQLIGKTDSIAEHVTQLQQHNKPIEALSVIDCCRTLKKAAVAWLSMTKEYLRAAVKGTPGIATLAGLARGASQALIAQVTGSISSMANYLYGALHALSSDTATELAQQSMLAHALLSRGVSPYDDHASRKLTTQSHCYRALAAQQAKVPIKQMKRCLNDAETAAMVLKNCAQLPYYAGLDLVQQRKFGTSFPKGLKTFVDACGRQWQEFCHLDEFDKAAIVGNISTNLYCGYKLAQAAKRIQLAAQAAEDVQLMNSMQSVQKALATENLSAVGDLPRHVALIDRTIAGSNFSERVKELTRVGYYGHTKGKIATAHDIAQQIAARKAALDASIGLIEAEQKVLLGKAVANAQPAAVAGMELITAEPCAITYLTQQCAQSGVKKFTPQQIERFQKALHKPFDSISHHKKTIERAVLSVVAENHVAAVASSHRSFKQAIYTICTQPWIADSCGGVEAVVHRLCEYEKVLAKVPGFITSCQKGNESLVQRIISAKHERNVRGALYEAAVAAELEKSGEVVEAIGVKVKTLNTAREFDVLTREIAIECKSIDWITRFDYEKFRASAGQCKRIAKDVLKKQYCIYAEKPIPEYIKEWLTKSEILYVELNI